LKLKNRIKEFFTLSWKKTAIALMIWIIAVFLHNMIYAFCMAVFKFKCEEAFLFLLAVIGIPLYFFVSTIYSLFKKFK